MDPIAEKDRIWRLWIDLERAQFQRRPEEPGYSPIDQLLVKPWHSTDALVRAAWELLTRPENLPGLEIWAIGMENFNPMAKEYTEAALKECRRRVGEKSGS
jgi:hypothetical protein